jgi:hypothetical protein
MIKQILFKPVLGAVASTKLDTEQKKKIKIKPKGRKSLNHFLNSFSISQAKVKSGIYTLEKIELNKIDVVFKNIANRNFFYWDKSIDKCIDWIKNNFNELPPVILEELNGKYYSVDGHHRITGALELEMKSILAFTIKVQELTHKRN